MSKEMDAIRSLLEKFPVSAWILDESGKIIYMNNEMRSLFGNHENQMSSIIIEEGSESKDHQPNGAKDAFRIISIADTPFRVIGTDINLQDKGNCLVEFFEDIAEEKSTRDSMLEALKKIRRETLIAKSIQNKIIPENKIFEETIAINSFYQPADDLGGDFFDILRISDDEYLVYIADVSGHGIQAALLTIYLRERVRANISAAKEGPAHLLGKVTTDFNSLEIDATLYVTMALCKYDKKHHELSIANAGHGCYPLVLRRNGRVETVPIKGLPVCAIAEEDSYEDETIVMNPGDRLILYTDGIIEEYDISKGGTFGPEGVRAVAEKYIEFDGRYVAHAIAEEAAKYGLMNAKDDRTIVVADILA